QVRYPRGEVPARGAVEEEVAQEAYAKAITALASCPRLEELGHRRFEHPPVQLAVAALQVAIVAALVGEVEVGPARLAQRRFRAREAEALGSAMQALQALAEL